MRQLSDFPKIKGHPLLGNLLEFRRDRVAFLSRVNEENGSASTVRARHGVFNMLITTDPNFAHEVLVDQAASFKKGYGLSLFMRPMLGNGLLTSEGDFHKRQRRMMSPAFAHKRIAEYATVIAERTHAAEAQWREGARIDLSEEMMRLTLEIVGKTLFDSEVSDLAPEVGEAITQSMKVTIANINGFIPIPPSWPTPRNRRALKHVAALDAVIYRLIKERREDGRDHGDFLSMLLLAQDEDDKSVMTDKQVRDEAMNIFLAGHETTANALAWTFYLLARHPDVRERLERELDSALGGRVPTLADLANVPFAGQVFKEAMRLYPPAYVVARLATREVIVGGTLLPAGQLVLINIIGMHRSSKLFPDPLRFDPDRFSPTRERDIPKHAFIPFAAGPRVCIGNHFALMEGALAVAEIAQRVRLELLHPRIQVAPEPLVTLRPKGGMPMIVRRRSVAERRVAPRLDATV